MSVFAQSLKTFTSDITGEELEYKINNAVWVILKGKFGLTQRDFVEQSQNEENLYSAKFVTAVMQANGMEVTENDVNENVDQVDLMKFVMAHNKAVGEKSAKLFGSNDEETSDDEGK